MSSLLLNESLGDIKLCLPLLVVLLSVLKLPDIDLITLNGEQGEVLPSLVPVNHQLLEPSLPLHGIGNLHDLCLSLILTLLHLSVYLKERLLVELLLLVCRRHLHLMETDQFGKDVNLLFQGSDLLLIVRRILIASLHDLFNPLSLNLHPV